MGHGQVELGAHGVQKNLAPEKCQHQRASLLTVTASCRSVVVDGLAGEYHLGKRTVADDLCLLLLLLENVSHAVAQILPQVVQVSVTARLSEHLECRARGRRGNGIPTEGRGHPHVGRLAEPVFAYQVHDFGTSPKGADREAAAERLAVGNQVRHHAVVLLRAPVGEPEAGYHLVEDEQHVMIGAGAAQVFEKSFLRGRATL